MLAGDGMFTVVGEASDSKAFFQLLTRESPDIIVLDLKLRGESGIEIAEKVRSESPHIRILILTAEAEESTVRQCIRIGVEGLISKESGREVYLEALYAIADDRSYFGGQFMGMLTKQPTSAALPELTDREVEVLKGFARGLSYKEIAAELGISPRTVETHKEKIQDKLKVKTIAELTRYAIKEGIIR